MKFSTEKILIIIFIIIINITNLSENYNETEISKLCEKFGKFEICDIKTNERNGKFAIVKFSKESDAKIA